MLCSRSVGRSSIGMRRWRGCPSTVPRQLGSSFSSSAFQDAWLNNRGSHNHSQMTPLSGMLKTVATHPHGIAYIHGEEKTTWREHGERCSAIASGLMKLGVRRGDVVSVIAPNSPSIFEAHFAVPGAGAVLNTINTRLDAKTVAYMLRYCAAKVVLVDSEHGALVADTMQLLKEQKELNQAPLPLIIKIDDPVHFAEMTVEERAAASSIPQYWDLTYDSLVASGDRNFALLPCLDEQEPIALNYTSGTTGTPKGVVTSYRNAFLAAQGCTVEMHIPSLGHSLLAAEPPSSYLFIVPMFHCNGWQFPWVVAASGTTSLFLRKIRADAVFDLMRRHRVGYMCGAPVTMLTMLKFPDPYKLPYPCKFWTAGAPPPPAVIKEFKSVTNIQVQCVYGLTEVGGPMSLHIPTCEEEDNEGGVPSDQGEKTNEQGLSRREMQVTWQTAGGWMDMTVVDPNSSPLTEVPRDGVTIGEVAIRGHGVMMGYLGNEKATREVFRDGYFLTGDLAVAHPNSRLEIKDRAKDIIISGGENISSIDVENVLVTHEAVFEAAVIAMPHALWGEVPCAFVVKAPGVVDVSEDELMKWSRQHLPHFSTPKRVVFVEALAKNSTGKVLKQELRKLLPTA